MSKVSRGVGNWLREDFDLAPAGNHIALNLNEYLKRHRVCLNQGLKQEEGDSNPRGGSCTRGWASSSRVFDGALIEAQGCHPYGLKNLNINKC